MVASGVGNLVDDGNLTWDTKEKDAVPGFRTSSEQLHHSASILDYLSMRTGMQQYGYGSRVKITPSFPQVPA